MKILFLQKRILFPPNTGGRIRTLNVLRHLAQWHEITYLCNVQADDMAHLDEMRELGISLETIPWHETPRSSLRFYFDLAANLWSPFPFTVAKDYDPALRRRASELLAADSYDLVICDFVQMAENARGLAAPASLLFQHNVEAEIFRRHAESNGSWARRRYMALQWKKMCRYEAAAGERFDAVIAVSQHDQSIFEKEYGWRHVRTIDTAVDVDYFSPQGLAEKPDVLVFVGSMDWLPNEDAVLDFCETTWPLIRSKKPHARFQIVGRNPTAAVQKLNGVNGVEVIGAVPDVRPYLEEAAVVVVPLRIGGGTRIKIYEALAMGKPLVSTTIGAEGLPVTSGEHLLLADGPQGFSRATVDLLDNTTARQTLGQRGRAYVAERFSAEQVARQFDAICRETATREQNCAVATQ